MALTKTSKKKKPSHQNNKKITVLEPPTPTPWPNLPQRLLNLISRQPILMQQITFNGINKSWQPPAKTCQSVSSIGSLAITNDKSDTELNTFSITFRTGYHRIARWPASRINKPFSLIGISHGSLITRNRLTSDAFYIFMPPEIIKYLPNINQNIPTTFASLSSTPQKLYKIRDDFIVIVLTGISHPAFLSYHSSTQHNWTEHDSTLIDPNDPQGGYMRFNNGVWFQKKFYGLSSQGTLAVIEEVDSSLAITNLGSGRAVPSAPAKHFREYLLESDGEILLVFLISRKSKWTVNDVEVYRLGLTRLGWMKVENLGDRALFVGGDCCCMMVDSRRVGCKRNCVYFTHDYVKGVNINWDVYNMGNCKVEPGWVENDSKGVDSFWFEV
ncbi:uncharacterized protein LOC124930010 [Impatiens glandulifera]|uniref:uncharacterized protein LOC124930010 n=1 Tax=Impatiens glandulifera TaxID=253017 RepID=UPI001FB107A1|nr:uncharacterized protein LOC124930010 [Impatiens glandulifera]